MQIFNLLRTEGNANLAIKFHSFDEMEQFAITIKQNKTIKKLSLGFFSIPMRSSNDSDENKLIIRVVRDSAY